jgi:very-short-patch-repair endonuclease
MSTPPTRRDAAPVLADYLRHNAHAFTRAQLLAGWSRHQLDASLSIRTVVRLLPDVYASADHVHHAVVMGHALNLWAPRGLVTGRLALHLYSSELPPPVTADLVVPNGDRMDAPPWIRVQQTGPLGQSCAPQAVRCTTPERALLDAWRFATPEDRRNLLYEALWARVCTWRQLRREAARAPRVAGRRDLERVLGWFAGGATSPLEVRAQHDTFADARFRDFEWQVDLRLGSRRATADMLHRGAKLVVELDGERYHSSRKDRNDDRNRDVDLAAAGYLTVRLGWDDVVRRPQWCRERLLAVLASRLERRGRS